MSDNINNEKIETVSNFIDDLNRDKKPRKVEIDNEMEQLFESIRAVKRLNSKYIEKKVVTSPWKRFTHYKKFVAVAVIVFLIAFTGIFQMPYEKNSNIAYAMMEAYKKLESYSGTIEIRSYTGDDLEFYETIDVIYKKPNKFKAVHKYDGYTYTQISDGDALYTIEGNVVTIDYSNPEKELWRYHLGQQIEEIQYANNITKIGTEIIFGRTTIIYQYGIADDQNSYKIWVDNETNLPLQKELVLPENRRLINSFVDIQINDNQDDSLFSYQPNTNQEIVELNKKVTINEVIEFWNVGQEDIEKLIKVIENENLKLEEVIELDNNNYAYLVKFKDLNNNYIDIYLGNNPELSIFFKESKVGIFADGWVEVTENAINIFKVYIGESNLIRWVVDNSYELTIVSSLDTDQITNILEEAKTEKIQYTTHEELEKIGIKTINAKEGH